MPQRATILTPNPDAIPDTLPFPHRVEVVAAGGWDDDDPPDETIVHFAPDLSDRIANVGIGEAIQIRLEDSSQLEDPRLYEAVDVALGEDRELKIRVKG